MGVDEKWSEYDYFRRRPILGLRAKARHGDLGGLRLARGDFVQALRYAFQRTVFGNDAAFLAERILTANRIETICRCFARD